MRSKKNIISIKICHCIFRDTLKKLESIDFFKNPRRNKFPRRHRNANNKNCTPLRKIEVRCSEHLQIRTNELSDTKMSARNKTFHFERPALQSNLGGTGRFLHFSKHGCGTQLYVAQNRYFNFLLTKQKKGPNDQVSCYQHVNRDEFHRSSWPFGT